MKLALSTVASDWPLDRIHSLARSLGFDALELNCEKTGDVPSPLLTLPVASLAGGELAPARMADGYFTRLIDLAAESKAPFVTLKETATLRHASRTATSMAVGERLLSLADLAAARGITLLLDVSCSLRTARETWTILDRVDHPSVGCIIDVVTAMSLGDSPEITVPMLNSRINAIQLSDVTNQCGSLIECDLGTGIVPLKTWLSRLRGIGFNGWAILQWPTGPQNAEARITHAIQTFRAWTTPPEKAKPKPKPAKAV
jgi:sugar phosphate isomerase/epimerase